MAIYQCGSSLEGGIVNLIETSNLQAEKVKMDVAALTWKSALYIE